jgi:hypothetical protein
LISLPIESFKLNFPVSKVRTQGEVTPAIPSKEGKMFLILDQFLAANELAGGPGTNPFDSAK